MLLTFDPHRPKRGGGNGNGEPPQHPPAEPSVREQVKERIRQLRERRTNELSQQTVAGRSLAQLVLEWERQKHAHLPTHCWPDYLRHEPSDAAVSVCDDLLPSVLRAVIHCPDAQVDFQEVVWDVTQDVERQITKVDRHAIASFRQSLVEKPRHTEKGRVWWLKDALAHVIRGRLQPDEAAELGAWIVAQTLATADLKRHSATATARAARVAALTRSADVMTDDDLARLVSLAAALANRTPNRTTQLRKSVRGMLRYLFEPEDLAQIAQHCMKWLLKAQRRTDATGQIEGHTRS